MNQTSILIIDDHPMMRTALKIALEDFENPVVIAEAGTLAEGKSKAQEVKPDLIILDLYLPDGSGEEMLYFRNEQLPATKVLVMTSSGSEQDLIKCVEAGAESYLSKESSPAQLLLAVKSVLSGESFLTPGATNILLKHIRLGEQSKPEAPTILSSREEDILRLLARGATNDEIAETLFIAGSTIRTHYQRILKKLGLKNHHQMVVYAVNRYQSQDH